ncbi:MAG TPA: type II toxin-antitoxin system VapC family toxin [Acidimicrobiia bacterium]|nr:type II toxin-antitoxin system VapC family toxin [Acidimicrobiia bacterium]
MRGLADTSVFVARESGRALDVGALPDELAVSVITLGELRAGVLLATDLLARDVRLATLTLVQSLEPIPIDAAVADAWASLRVRLREAGRRMPLNDSWIAATAIAHGIAVVTQDDDYAAAPSLAVIRV